DLDDGVARFFDPRIGHGVAADVVLAVPAKCLHGLLPGWSSWHGNRRSWRRRSSGQPSGTASTKQLPPPSRASQRTPPPWRSAIGLTKVRPRPTPPTVSACPGRR